MTVSEKVGHEKVSFIHPFIHAFVPSFEHFDQDGLKNQVNGSRKGGETGKQ